MSRDFHLEVVERLEIARRALSLHRGREVTKTEFCVDICGMPSPQAYGNLLNSPRTSGFHGMYAANLARNTGIPEGWVYRGDYMFAPEPIARHIRTVLREFKKTGKIWP